MARPIYSYELEDPDFSWLLTRYRETHPNCYSIEATCLPVVLICAEGDVIETAATLAPIEDCNAPAPALRGNK